MARNCIAFSRRIHALCSSRQCGRFTRPTGLVGSNLQSEKWREYALSSRENWSQMMRDE
jgi:hypothetical protein